MTGWNIPRAGVSLVDRVMASPPERLVRGYPHNKAVTQEDIQIGLRQTEMQTGLLLGDGIRGEGERNFFLGDVAGGNIDIRKEFQGGNQRPHPTRNRKETFLWR